MRPWPAASGGEGGRAASLRRLRSGLETAGSIDPGLSDLARRSDDAFYELEDVADSLRHYLGSLSFSPERLEEVESRLADIRKLKKKYGATVEDVLARLEEDRDRLSRLETWEEDKGEIERRIAAMETEVLAVGLALSEKRKAAATGLQARIEAIVRTLGMPSARFFARVGRKDTDGGRPVVGPYGVDEVEFLIAPNPGESAKPLARIASGGELSRVALAAKTVLAGTDSVDCLIFDEVDAGIGGEVAVAVGEHLKELGKSKQVLCITHLASIAVRADNHYRVEKDISGGRTSDAPFQDGRARQGRGDSPHARGRPPRGGFDRPCDGAPPEVRELAGWLMGKITQEQRNRYFEKVKEHRKTIEAGLAKEKTLLDLLAKDETGAGYKRLKLANDALDLCSWYMLVNGLSVSLLGIKNEDYLLEARKTLVRAIKYIEDTVSAYLDVPFSDYEAKLEEIKDFDSEGRFRLLRKLGFAVQSLEDAFGENSKYSASFIEVWGKVATVGKNLVNLKTAVPDMDFSSPVRATGDEPPRPRQAAIPAQRRQVPRAVRAVYAQGAGLPGGGHLPPGPPEDSYRPLRAGGGGDPEAQGRDMVDQARSGSEEGRRSKELAALGREEIKR